jgi:hypothetical protein
VPLGWSLGEEQKLANRPLRCNALALP